MTHGQIFILSTTGCLVLALVAVAFLILFRNAGDYELAVRIGGLRRDAVMAQPRAPRFLPVLISALKRLGNAMRGRMLSTRDSEVLGRTLAASGFEATEAMPIFMGAKAACLFVLPGLVYMGTVVLGCSTGRQIGYSAASMVVGMLLPNWIMGLIRAPYQQALRRGIPDALDLLVVCTEAGLGLESALERVAQEMTKSNRPVGVEFSILSREMRIMPDRRIALENFSERAGQPALRRLAGTMSQTIKYGTPLGPGLRTLAAEMRTERMTQFEERAARLPALLTLPMILFILPCLFIIIMGQPATQLMALLGSMYN